MQITRTNPTELVEIPGISHVVAVGGGTTVHIGGQVPLDATGALVGDDLLTQAKQALANLATCLDAAGVGPADVVRINVYVVGPAHESLDDLYEALAATWPEPPTPASTLLGVNSLFMPGQLVEVDAVAVRSDA